jgi:Zinc-ribbon/Ring finger domain
MTDKDGPYHCHDCGFCRVGGRDNFRHCHDCGMCIDINLLDDHNCKSGKYMSNCPVCQEDLFSSRFASHEMPCGHAIHWHCFQELISYDTRCPVCKKTAESPEDMAATWSTLAVGIACQPVPPDLARVVNILCIDCEQPSNNRCWHFLGVRCHHCLSFNTCVEQIVLQGRPAAEYLESRERNATVPTDITMLHMRQQQQQQQRQRQLDHPTHINNHDDDDNDDDSDVDDSMEDDSDVDDSAHDL